MKIWFKQPSVPIRLWQRFWNRKPNRSNGSRPATHARGGAPAVVVKEIGIPSGVLNDLRRDLDSIEGLSLGELIGAAVWSFGREESEDRARVVCEFWLHGGRALPPARRREGKTHGLSAVYLSKSSVDLLAGVQVKPFSKEQTLAALLDWFMTRPPYVRLESVEAYL